MSTQSASVGTMPHSRKRPDFLRFVLGEINDQNGDWQTWQYRMTIDEIESFIVRNVQGRGFSKTERDAWMRFYGQAGENCSASQRKDIFRVAIAMVFQGAVRIGSVPDNSPISPLRLRPDPVRAELVDLVDTLLETGTEFPATLASEVDAILEMLLEHRPGKNSVLEFTQCNGLLGWSHKSTVMEEIYHATKHMSVYALDTEMSPQLVEIACFAMSAAYPLGGPMDTYKRNLVRTCTDIIQSAYSEVLPLLELANKNVHYDSEDEPMEPWFGNTVARISAENTELETVPSAAVHRRLERGDFGYFPGFGVPGASSSLARPMSTSEMLHLQRCGFHVPGSEFGKRYLPNNTGRLLASYDNWAYGGKFSDDGNMFFCYTQSYATYVYDTSDLSNPKFLYRCPFPTAVWTVTDAAMDRKNRFLAQCTRSDCIHVTQLKDDGSPELLGHDLEVPTRYGRHVIYSVEFTPDSSGILYAKGDGTIGLFDFESTRVVQMRKRHEDEVNSARFVDDSANVVVSGSDDSTIRVWDRRDWTKRESGALVGHLEGITSVASRGDGFYVVSNSKDQTAKLWDLRTMVSKPRDIKRRTENLCTHFYYQDRDYIPAKVKRHPYDHSVMTYRGHEVLQTAIRAKFSPLHSTGGQYIYSGSADGDVYIWKLDGTLVRQLRGTKALRKSNYLTSRFYPDYDMHSNNTMGLSREASNCIRECSWHPHAPVIYAPAICKDQRHDAFFGGKGALFSFTHEHDFSYSHSVPKGEFDYVSTRESSSLRYLNSLYNRRHVA